MANIFKSKEVLKDTSPDMKINPVRVVRGVYVSGPYRPPYYISHTLTINSVNTRNGKVVAYTEAYKHAPSDYGTAWISASSNSYSITRYSVSTKHISSCDYGTAWIDARSTTPYSITQFTTVTKDIPPSDYGTAWIDVYTTQNYTIEPFITIFTKMPVEQPLVNIISTGSTVATVSTE